MLETFVEFTFDAAHQIPPFSTVHGHTFRATVYLTGERDPRFGWTHNLYDVAPAVESVKNRLDHCYLNDIDGIGTASLENLTVWIWTELDKALPGVDRVMLRRGLPGAEEGCCYSGRAQRQAA
ncbi:MAG: 6-pyruvoyl tetrahydropterin synthase family protein [Acetobacteraceae bacterium]